MWLLGIYLVGAAQAVNFFGRTHTGEEKFLPFVPIEVDDEIPLQPSLGDLLVAKMNNFLHLTPPAPPAVLLQENVEHSTVKSDAAKIPGIHHGSYFWWVHLISFGFMLKSLCILSSMCMQFAPLGDISQIRKEKDTGCRDSLSYVSIACTGTQWCLYGLFAYYYTGNHGFLVVVYANVVGACMGTYYSIIFHLNVRDDAAWRMMKFYYFIAACFFFSQFVVFEIRPVEQSLLLSGCCSAVLSVVVTVSPLSTVGLIIRDESVASMPVELSLVSFVASWLWMVCGLMLHDWWILIPNIVGILIGSFASWLIWKYGTFFGELGVAFHAWTSGFFSTGCGSYGLPFGLGYSGSRSATLKSSWSKSRTGRSLSARRRHGGEKVMSLPTIEEETGTGESGTDSESESTFIAEDGESASSYGTTAGTGESY